MWALHQSSDCGQDDECGIHFSWFGPSLLYSVPQIEYKGNFAVIYSDSAVILSMEEYVR